MRKAERQLYVDEICKQVNLGTYTLESICQSLNLASNTFQQWLKRYPEIKEQYEQAKGTATINFVNRLKLSARGRLMQRVNGYTAIERTVKRTSELVEQKEDGNGTLIEGELAEVTVKEKHINPDTTAIIFALCNADPENFKNHRNYDINQKVTIEQNPYKHLPSEDLKKLIELKKKARLLSGNETADSAARPGGNSGN